MRGLDDIKNVYCPSSLLKHIRSKFPNQLIIGQLNINSLRNKFDDFDHLMNGNLDIIVLTESSLDDSFLMNQFSMVDIIPLFVLIAQQMVEE